MVFPRQLTIQLRKRQLVNIFGTSVFYAGANPMSLAEVTGTIDTTWHDFTDFVEGLEKIQFEFTVEQGENGQLEDGHFSTPKSVSGELSFERDAYEFIKAWLVEDVASPLNQIEVQITDTNCGAYVGYVITSRQLEWCQFDALCTFNLNLKQIDDPIQCIQRTVINDNWQGWFQPEPADGKKYPRFGYCIEKRPNWTLVLLWLLTALSAVLFSVIYTIFFPLLIAIWVIKTIISGIVTAINFIIGVINDIIDAVNTLGFSIPNIDPIDEYDPGPFPATPIEVFMNFSNVMIETAGCGREHVAPLVRDYLLNVCNKCGVEVSATTAPIFFAPITTTTHSDNEEYIEPNPYYNACYLWATVKRGIRRFRSINLFDGSTDEDTTTYWQTENAPNLPGDKFLDEVCGLFNQQWRIVNAGTAIAPSIELHIYRKDEPYRSAPLYDFSFGGADRAKIIDGICYQPQEVNYPAYCSFLYDDDTADKCGVEAGDFYNGVQTINFENSIINPLFEGELDKHSGFGATHFNCDGSTTNYLYDALQVVYSLVYIGSPAFAAITIPIMALADELANLIQRFADYKILMQSETMSLPKMLIWDGDTDNPSDPNYRNATAIRDRINIGGTVYTIGKSAQPGTVSGITTPEVNPLYPTQIPSGGTTSVPSTIASLLVWEVNHPPQTDVNMRFPPSSSPFGVYEVRSIFGGVELSAAAILVNFPMYFEPHYKGTLWDRFHYIDDPRRYPRLNKRWMLKIPLCCEDVETLQLTNAINRQKLLSSVLLDTTYYNVGIITKIMASYEQDDELGQYIQLQGIV